MLDVYMPVELGFQHECLITQVTFERPIIFMVCFMSVEANL